MHYGRRVVLMIGLITFGTGIAAEVQGLNIPLIGIGAAIIALSLP